jgi:hypothetical protein
VTTCNRRALLYAQPRRRVLASPWGRLLNRSEGGWPLTCLRPLMDNSTSRWRSAGPQRAAYPRSFGLRSRKSWPLPRPQDNPPTSWSNFGPKYDDIALVAVNQEVCARAERRNGAIEL